MKYAQTKLHWLCFELIRRLLFHLYIYTFIHGVMISRGASTLGSFNSSLQLLPIINHAFNH